MKWQPISRSSCHCVAPSPFQIDPVPCATRRQVGVCALEVEIVLSHRLRQDIDVEPMRQVLLTGSAIEAQDPLDFLGRLAPDEFLLGDPAGHLRLWQAAGLVRNDLDEAMNSGAVHARDGQFLQLLLVIPNHDRPPLS
jgi:hypothetical protein